MATLLLLLRKPNKAIVLKKYIKISQTIFIFAPIFRYTKYHEEDYFREIYNPAETIKVTHKGFPSLKRV